MGKLVADTLRPSQKAVGGTFPTCPCLAFFATWAVFGGVPGMLYERSHNPYNTLGEFGSFVSGGV
jgi:hypothetical protein